MTTRSFRSIIPRAGVRMTFALALAAFLLAGFSFAETTSAAPLAYAYTVLTVQNRIGIGTETPDANTVLDALRSDTTDTYIRSRHATKGAYFQTMSGINWAGYNMLNAVGVTSTYFGYRGNTQFRIFDSPAGEDRILMDAAGTANGAIYLNPSNTGGVGIGTTSLGGNRLVVTTSTTGSWDAISADMTGSTGYNFAVHATSASDNGRGVSGRASHTTGVNFGVHGQTESDAGYGVAGFGPGASQADGSLSWAESGGRFGSYDENSGVVGTTNASNMVGVLGDNFGTGSGSGVFGYKSGTSGQGVEAQGGQYALWAHGGSSYAGYFSGNVHVAGTLTKSAGGFQIEHPLDPTKYLNHSFVESPDMKNLYDGVVTLDENGEAVVELPDWFEALNQDFRYQLTPIGASMPDLYIAQGVEGNAFKIAGGVAGGQVSWQVTGIRHDDYAEAHRIPVEEDKPADLPGSDSATGIDPNPSEYEEPVHK